MVIQAHEGRVNISNYYMVYEDELVESPLCESGDCGFEPHHTHKKERWVRG